MLENNDREKLEKYIEKILKSIYSDIKKNMENGMSNQDVIENTVNLAVNKLTPESKMILSSTYNMLMEKTLAKPLYQETANKSLFYSRDILKDLNSKFTFDVPDHIDFEESKKTLDKWMKAGVVFVVGAGAVISITTNNVTPVVIAVIIAGGMWLLLRDKSVKGNTQDVSDIIKDYLRNVKKTLMSWINEIEIFYDAEVRKLEEGMVL